MFERNTALSIFIFCITCGLALSTSVAQTVNSDFERIVRLSTVLKIENINDVGEIVKFELPVNSGEYNALFERIYLATGGSKSVLVENVNRNNMSASIRGVGNVINARILTASSTETNPWVRVKFEQTAGLTVGYHFESRAKSSPTINMDLTDGGTISYSGTPSKIVKPLETKFSPEILFHVPKKDNAADGSVTIVTIEVANLEGLALGEAFIKPMPESANLHVQFGTDKITLNSSRVMGVESIVGARLKVPALASAIRPLSLLVKASHDVTWTVIPRVGERAVANGKLIAGESQTIQVPGLEIP